MRGVSSILSWTLGQTPSTVAISSAIRTWEDYFIRQDRIFAEPASGKLNTAPVGVSQTASEPEARALITPL